MKAKYWIFVIAGLAAIIAGFCLAKGGEAASPVPYVMLGLGAGAMGHGAGFLLRQYSVKGCAEAEKRLRIEEQWPGVEVTVLATHGLTSYYAQHQGLLIGF